MKRKNLVGQKFGKLTVNKMIYNYKNTGKTKCLCSCDCGSNNILRDPYIIEHAKMSSCGCAKREVIINSVGKELVGQRFGKLIVKEINWDNVPPQVLCKCDCGKEVWLDKKSVQCNHTKSCGCLKVDRISIVNYTDYTNVISNYDIKILYPSIKNKHNQQLWKCECYCGKKFDELPARIMNGHVRSCGCLKQSSGERYISSVLDELQIKYIPQYTYNDCKSNKNYTMHFDFGILNNQDDIVCLFEYDGSQHDEPILFFGGVEGFIQRQIRDNLKNEYCISHNIPLYRFSYLQSFDEIKQEIINIFNP